MYHMSLVLVGLAVYIAVSKAELMTSMLGNC